MLYDVAIIGAGVVGSALFRELGRYQLSTVLIEKENDVSLGSSRANSAIVHAGYDLLWRVLTWKEIASIPNYAKSFPFPFVQTAQ